MYWPHVLDPFLFILTRPQPIFADPGRIVDPETATKTSPGGAAGRKCRTSKLAAKLSTLKYGCQTGS
jgi:hypothetical protein